jgi:hypothetical protein
VLSHIARSVARVTSANFDPADYDVVPTPIEEVQTGWSLVIKHEGHAVLFQVDKKKFSHNQAQGTLFTLESEPLASGQPLRIQGPAGTTTRRIVKKH